MPYAQPGTGNTSGVSGGASFGQYASPFASLLARLATISRSGGVNPLKEQLASQYGMGKEDLPETPFELTRTHQAGRAVGETALGFVPFAGPFLSMTASQVGGEKVRRAGEKYMQKLMQANPEYQELGLKAPKMDVSSGERIERTLLPAGIGQGAAMGATLGSVVPGLGTAVGAVAGGVAGAIGKRRAKKRSAEHEKEMKEQLAENQSDINQWRARKAQRAMERRTATPPVIPFLTALNALAQRNQNVPNSTPTV